MGAANNGAGLTYGAAFGAAYLAVIVIEPLADLAVLPGAKSLKQFKDSALLEPRLFNPVSRRGRVVLG